MKTVLLFFGKNNAPRYLIIEYSIAEQEEAASNKDIMELLQRLIAKNMAAYKVLAKLSFYHVRKF